MEAIRSSETGTLTETSKMIKFKVKKPRTVKWTKETKDNEGMGLKKSKSKK